MFVIFKLIFALMSAVLLALPASAYIGPSAGAGGLAVILGVLVSICLGVLAVFWYPLKRGLRALRSRRNEKRHARLDT